MSESSGSPRALLERMGLLPADRSAFMARVRPASMKAHNPPLKPPLPNPEGLLIEQGAPPPDRGATRPFPTPLSAQDLEDFEQSP